MTPLLRPSDDPVADIQSTLVDSLDRVYRDPLIARFVGSTVEEWLPVRRLVEAGWTLAMVAEAILGARDGNAEGLEEVAGILEGETLR